MFLSFFFLQPNYSGVPVNLSHQLHPSLAISKSLEPVTGQLSNTIAAKLTAVEVTLKDNVSKVVKSKASVWPCILCYPELS